MLKITFKTITTLGVLYFIIGFVFVQLNKFDIENYLMYGSIIGGIATFISLLSFSRPSISKEDLKKAELDTLKSVVEATEKIQRTENELTKLGKQREEMELLIKKVGLSLFLRDQIQRNQERLLIIIEENRELANLIENIKENKERLETLEEEISLNEDIELINEIIKESKENKKNLEEVYIGLLDSLPLGNLMSTLFKILIRR